MTRRREIPVDGGDAGGGRERERARPRVADVALLLEGTYPYIMGGVSSWVHTIIRGLPELSFTLVFLGAKRESRGEMKYELPENVIGLEEEFILDATRHLPPGRRRGKPKAFARVPDLIESFKQATTSLHEDVAASVREMLVGPASIGLEDFLHGEASWGRIRESFERYSTDPSFLDYFWTVRTMHQPLFKLAAAAERLPPARVYHSISTGYAGFLGMLLRALRRRPFVLTEHGIYTKERKIDLGQADWIREAAEPFSGALENDVGHLRKLWIGFFEGLGRLAYAAADPIVALYDGNRRRQIEDGAAPERTRVVPNGIDLARFAKMRAPATARIPPVLGLIGRVVPIKDIKTFVRTIRALSWRLPDVEGWIIGPEDENPEYARECHELVAQLGLVDRVRFLGFQKVEHILPRIGLLTLTSISEALPLVILEGFAAGVPALVTDVGSCRELIEGGVAEDRALGPAGAVAPIAGPEELAQRAWKLLTDSTAWQAARVAGIRRVEQFYTLDTMLSRYREIYREALTGAAIRRTPDDALPIPQRELVEESWPG